jgi:SOS response regulatory protein OraA/RecX
VTALVAEPRDRVRVELDGSPWRSLPAAAVVGARLAVGAELDRPRARKLRRELRRVEALTVATRALARHDHSTARLDAKLERRGVAPADREAALQALGRAGYLDDARFAGGRAETLASRGYGDEAIRFDLERAGIDADAVDAAVDALAPEAERAAAIVAGSDRSVKVARRLAAKGFAAETLESLFS